ncbi:MAG: sugar kinase [Chloroflexi bacterium]|nr:sugar kinase [Chloroflexota bacterium]
MKRYELITFGENMIRLSTRDYERLEQAQTLDVRHGGTEANVAVGLARLGHRTAWLSRLGDNALGHRIERDIASWGTDTSRVIWAPDERVGVFFLEVGAGARGSSVLYDRRDSSMSRMGVETFPWEWLAEAGWLHLTGITTAISSSCEELVRETQRRAHEAGLTVSYDVNYRAKLWTPERAREVVSPLCRDADIMFMKHSDVERVFGIREATAEDDLRALASRFARKVVVMTAGADGALAFDQQSGQIARAPAHPLTHVVDRVGAGDAFAAGFIAGYLETGIECGLRMGNAMAALKMTIQGDYALVSRAEVDGLLAGRSGGISR